MDCVYLRTRGIRIYVPADQGFQENTAKQVSPQKSLGCLRRGYVSGNTLPLRRGGGGGGGYSHVNKWSLTLGCM